MRYPLNFNQRTMDFEDDVPSAPSYHQSNQLQYGVYPKPVASPSCPTLSKDTPPKKRQSCPSTTSCCLWFSLVISLMVSVILLACIWMGLFVSETSCETTQPPPPVVVNTTTTTVIFTPCGSATLPFWKKPIRGKGQPQPAQPDQSSGQLQVLELPPWKAKSATYKRFRLTNGLGIEVDLLSLGATVTSVRVPDKDGVLSDVVLGFDDVETYLEHCGDGRGHCLGSILGRNVQPMDGCGFTLDRHYNVSCHGGFQARNWQSHVVDDAIVFSLTSNEGDLGYPGDVIASAKFSLTPDKMQLNVEYIATSSRPTPFNMAQNLYFNLAGHQAGPIKLLNHNVKVNADAYTPTDQDGVPTGSITPVTSKSPFYMGKWRALGAAVTRIYRHQVAHSVVSGGHQPPPDGLAVNFVAKTSGNNRFLARVQDNKSGRFVQVASNQPCLQLQTLDGTWSGLQGKDGNLYKNGAGVSLRPQGYPDAVNHFRSSPWGVLYPGNVYIHTTSYNFGVMKRNLMPNETVS